MRKTLLLVSLVLIVALRGASAPAASTTEPVPLGATQAQVQDALGQPNKGQFSAGGMTTWFYEQGQIEFTNGRVDRVQWREITPLPERGTTNAPVVTLPAASSPKPVPHGATALSGRGDPAEADEARAADKAMAAVERDYAMRQLAETGAVDQVEVFLEALRHDDNWGVRNIAARALIQRGWKPDNLNDTILSAIYRSDRPALVKIGPPAVQPMLDAYTQNHVHPWYGVGTWIPYAIAEIGNPRAIPLLTGKVLPGFQPRPWPRDTSVLTPTLSENSLLRESVLGSFDMLIRMGHPAQEYLASQLADTNRASAYILVEALRELQNISTNMAKTAFLSPLLPLLREMDQQRQRVLISEFTVDDKTKKLTIPRDLNLNPLADERKLIPFAEFFKTSLQDALVSKRYAVQESGTPIQDARTISLCGTLKATVRVRRAGLRKIDVITLGLVRVFEDLCEDREFWGDCQVSVEATYRQGTKTVRKTYTSRTEHKVTAYRYGLLADETRNIVDNMVRDLEAFAHQNSNHFSHARTAGLPKVESRR